MRVIEGENEGGKWEMIFKYFIKKKEKPNINLYNFKN